MQSDELSLVMSPDGKVVLWVMSTLSSEKEECDKIFYEDLFINICYNLFGRPGILQISS